VFAVAVENPFDFFSGEYRALFENSRSKAGGSVPKMKLATQHLIESFGTPFATCEASRQLASRFRTMRASLPTIDAVRQDKVGTCVSFR
jgi:hypothetical protein